MKNLAEYPIVQHNAALFDALSDTPQDPIHHQEGNVYVHTQMVLDALLELPEFARLNVREQEILVYTALFHDIAKPLTTEIGPDGRIGHPRHAPKGAQLARRALDLEGRDFAFVSSVYYMILYHGYPIKFFDKPNPLRSAITTSLLANNHLLYVFAKADILGRTCPDTAKLLYDLDCFREFCLEHQVYGQPKRFASDFDRFHYFHHDDSYPDTQLFPRYNLDIYLMSGLPASGKDTYIAKHLSHLPIISLDALRKEMGVAPTDNQGTVIQAAKAQSKVYCRHHKSFVWNATNLTRNMRATLIGTWLPYWPKIHLVFTWKNIDRILADNQARERDDKIPNAKIWGLFEKLELPDLTEGHEWRLVEQE
jgi:predicted kinase